MTNRERVSNMTTPISAELPVVPAAAAGYADVTAVDVATAGTFERFYFEHRDSVVRAVALAIGDPDQAADSTDEAMIRAYQRWDRVTRLDRPAGWVYRVAVNHSRSRMRRVARRARYIRGHRAEGHEDRPFADGIEDDALTAALGDLDPDQRAVVVLRVLLQYSELECAAALEIRPGTAKSRLHRGLARLRVALPHLAPDIDRLATRDDVHRSS